MKNFMLPPLWIDSLALEKGGQKSSYLLAQESLALLLVGTDIIAFLWFAFDIKATASNPPAIDLNTVDRLVAGRKASWQLLHGCDEDIVNRYLLIVAPLAAGSQILAPI